VHSADIGASVNQQVGQGRITSANTSSQLGDKRHRDNIGANERNRVHVADHDPNGPAEEYLGKVGSPIVVNKDIAATPSEKPAEARAGTAPQKGRQPKRQSRDDQSPKELNIVERGD
jgi:hypothetical protein